KAGGARGDEDGDCGLGAQRRCRREVELRAGSAGLSRTAPGDATPGGRVIMPDVQLDFGSLREVYKYGAMRPCDVIRALYGKIQDDGLDPVWISVLPRKTAMARARELFDDSLATALSLYGMPFAIKDNIDLEGLPTTAGCPAYAY